MSDDQNTTQDPNAGAGQPVDPNAGSQPYAPPSGQAPVSPAQPASYNPVPPATGGAGYTADPNAATAGQQAANQGAYAQPVAGQPAAAQPMGSVPPVPPAGSGQPPAGGGLTGIMDQNVNVQDLVTNAGTYQQQAQQLFANKPVPPHPNTVFEEKKFVQLLAGSISLTTDEKLRIFDSIPKLSQYQINELIKIFEEEGVKFQELEKKHADEIAKLETQHSNSAEAVAQREEEEKRRKEEEEQQALLMQQLGQSTPTSDTFELLFYVNEEMCGKKTVSKTITSEEAIAEAKADPNVMAKIQGKEIADAVYTPEEKVVITIN